MLLPKHLETESGLVVGAGARKGIDRKWVQGKFGGALSVQKLDRGDDYTIVHLLKNY